MEKPPTPELAFRLGAEAMRTHIAAWAMSKGLAPIAIDILNMRPPQFALQETFTLTPAADPRPDPNERTA